MGIAKVTRNYQVTIPIDVRKTKEINIGDSLLFSDIGEKIVIIKMDNKKLIKELFGIWKGKIKEDSMTYVKKIRGEWDKRAKRLGI
ncbi:MAG: AbrB/MazE/SpoVT family DNA-binding domain-containing protein [Nanoarchaeota archaeon]|mgnify:FL=1